MIFKTYGFYNGTAKLGKRSKSTRTVGASYCGFNAVSGERYVERLNAPFEFLNPAFNPVSDAMTADDMCDTKSGEDGASSTNNIFSQRDCFCREAVGFDIGIDSLPLQLF